MSHVQGFEESFQAPYVKTEKLANIENLAIFCPIVSNARIPKVSEASAIIKNIKKSSVKSIKR